MKEEERELWHRLHQTLGHLTPLNPQWQAYYAARDKDPTVKAATDAYLAANNNPNIVQDNSLDSAISSYQNTMSAYSFFQSNNMLKDPQSQQFWVGLNNQATADLPQKQQQKAQLEGTPDFQAAKATLAQASQNLNQADTNYDKTHPQPTVPQSGDESAT